MTKKKFTRRDILKATGKITLAVGTGVIAATSLSNCGSSNTQDDGGMSDGEDAGYHTASAGTLSPRGYTPVET
jgi:hypothetical protein